VFTGRVEYSELYRYISAMDIGLNPLKHVKKNEITVGGKVFNYLACGKPVLTSRMPALEHLLKDELFYYEDQKTFVQMVKRMLEQKHDIKRYLKIARTFDWTKIAGNYEEVLRNSIK
jgi:glycosyltransferase involved in cell wall biosynthesis